MNHLTTRCSTSTEWPEQALPEAWMNRLFEKMLCEYGAKFSDQWGGTDPQVLKRHWAVRLFGLTGAELHAGLAALELRPWPPTLPEFVKLCRPPVDPLRAYHEALDGMAARERGEVGVWSHPAIFHAAVRIGRHALQGTEWRQIRERWEMVLAEVLAEGSWGAVPVPAPQLALSASPEAKLAALKQLRCLVEGGLRPKGGVGWAYKIVARHAGGDPSVTPAMLEDARSVLDRTATIDTIDTGDTHAPATA